MDIFIVGVNHIVSYEQRSYLTQVFPDDFEAAEECYLDYIMKGEDAFVLLMQTGETICKVLKGKPLFMATNHSPR